VVTATIVGFAGGKLYFLAEHAGDLSVDSFGSSGFTWYGGLIAGVAAVVVMARRYRLPLVQLAGVAAAPLSVAYGIGRIGCFLAGDGSYGQPSDLPWATAFPDGAVPTAVPVHPAALYEAVVALAVGGLLWALRTRWSPSAVVGLYTVLSGSARFLVEEIRINPEALAGLTQPQLWSALLVVGGAALLVITAARGSRPAPAAG
jgi:phosphatidylglycerol:prolipoprotein diacylglycerol transferase